MTKRDGYTLGKQGRRTLITALGLSLLLLGSGHAQEPQGFIPGADDYLCYRTVGQDINALVRLSDQFDGLGEIESNQPGDFRNRMVREARWHCNPVQKRILAGPNAGFVQPINHPQIHYTCHRIEPNRDPQVTVEDQHEFGAEILDVDREAFLCSPAFKQVLDIGD
jgi:hypothetical protein